MTMAHVQLLHDTDTAGQWSPGIRPLSNAGAPAQNYILVLVSQSDVYFLNIYKYDKQNSYKKL